MPRGRQDGRRSALVIATVAAALVVLVAAFLPWVRSGEADRSSFDLVRTAERLDLLSGTTRDLAVVWYGLPGGVALLWLAVTLRRRRAAAFVGCLALLAVAVVVASPLKIRAGVPMAGVGGVAALCGALLLAVERPRHM